jgi:hypothetical protein
MQIIVELGGVVRCVYSEQIDLTTLGNPLRIYLKRDLLADKVLLNIRATRKGATDG